MLDSSITLTALPEAAEAVFVHAGKDVSAYVCLANVHMLVLGARKRDLQKVMEKATWVLPDGMPLIWLLNRRGFPQAKRIPGTDLTLKLCEMAAGQRTAVGFFGSTTETLQALKRCLLNRFPELRITYCESPPILPEKPEVDVHVVSRLKRSGAKLVFVGLGCPKQEFWMAAHSPHVPAVLIGVGAAFDFLAGTIKRAPLWMQKIGLEWFYRLCREPRRLWRRYLVGNALFVCMVTKEMVSKKNRV